jgi:hypothetical protein
MQVPERKLSPGELAEIERNLRKRKLVKAKTKST